MLGKKFASTADFPCRHNPIPRPIPEKLWYTEPITVILCSGLLPFGSIFIEIRYIFSSIWSYKIYYVYGFMLVGVIVYQSTILILL